MKIFGSSAGVSVSLGGDRAGEDDLLGESFGDVVAMFLDGRGGLALWLTELRGILKDDSQHKYLLIYA